MSIPVTLLLAAHAGAQPAQPIFDECVAAFRARKAFSVSIDLEALINTSVVKDHFRLAFEPPNKVLLVKVVNGAPNLYFWLNGSKFLAYDPANKEMAVRSAPTQGPIVNRLANVVGGLEDAVSAQLSPDTMAAFLSPFRQVKDWSKTTSPGRITLSHAGKVNGKGTLTKFEFSTSSKLLTRAVLVGPSSRLLWVFNYGPSPHNLIYAPPRGTKLVRSLAEHARVNASDPKARNLVDRSLRAYSRLDSIAFSVSTRTGASDDWMSGPSFRERQSAIDWSYYRGVLTIRDLAHGKSYRGKCKPTQVLSYLKLLKRPMDPMLRAMLLKQNPIGSWFLPSMVVTTRGTVQIKGVSCEAVELQSRLIDVSLLIRQPDNLVTSVVSRTKDVDGKLLSEQERNFTYWRVNRPIPVSTFQLPVNKPLPLSKIGK